MRQVRRAYRATHEMTTDIAPTNSSTVTAVHMRGS